MTGKLIPAPLLASVWEVPAGCLTTRSGRFKYTWLRYQLTNFLHFRAAEVHSASIDLKTTT